jgi:crossover junction endodeoxyribonuclease RuvC
MGDLRDSLVLGIDPGTRVVGYGAVEVAAAGPRCVSAGVLQCRASLAVPERLGQISAGLERLMAELRPGVVVVEEAFAARNVQSALRIGEGRGVVLACATRLGARVVQVPPAVAKKALVGHGGAHKTQVAEMVARVLRLERPPEPLDVTDALALALTYVTRPTALETRP